MNSQLLVPKKVKVGFQERGDCYTKKLGYVIAWDGKKWRKEGSWQSWRDKKIAIEEFENLPTNGFVLNKKVGGTRYNWNPRQTYSRVHDPRGFEFEITVPNLLYILEHSNCMRGKGLEGDFIYSWDGKDLVLLPAEAPEYQAAMNFTKLQEKKISAKDLVPGCSYKTKKEEDLIYLGRFMWYESDWYKKKTRTGKKCHIFFQEKQIITDEDGYKEEIGGEFIIKNDVSFLATQNSTEPVSNYAKLMDKFAKEPRSSDIMGFELVPVEISLESCKRQYYNEDALKRNTYFVKNGDMIIEKFIHQENKWNGKTYDKEGYTVQDNYGFNAKTKELARYERSYSHYSYYEKKNLLKEQDLKNLQFNDLYVILENGKKKKLEFLTQIG